VTTLFSKVAFAVSAIPHGWTSPVKAQAMAAAIYALRPEISVEIGVYAGKGVVAMGLAHKEIGRGKVIGIDPYLPAASAEGQVKPEDKKFWSTLDHQAIKQMCLETLGQHGLHEVVQIISKKSDDVTPPDNIGFLRVDGNHGEQALKDAMRFAPKCRIGAILHLDDIAWSGGGVAMAAEYLVETGWVELYPLDDGKVFQRVK
jgi:hypothetical protein